MESSRACKSCHKRALVQDDVTGNTFCSSCGTLQAFDNYEAQIGGINGPVGTFVHVGTSGTGTVYSYKEKKIFEARNLIDELMYRLGLAGPKSIEVKNMIDKITEGEFGQGDWFPILIGACAYVVMRSDNKSLPIAEVASVIGSDEHELGRMIARVVAFLGLELPDFDIVGVFERTVKNSPSLASVDRDKVERMTKQGVFLMQCAIKWFLTTGRRPLPVVAAVMVFVAQINQIDIRIEDVAKEVHATVFTCKSRYKEILEALVVVAKVLPWGKDITTKNIVKNAPFVIQYMELKAMSKPKKARHYLNDESFDLDCTVSECLRKDIEYDTEVYGMEKNPQCCDTNDQAAVPRWEVNDLDGFKFSHECLAMIYSKFLNDVGGVNFTGDSEKINGRKRKRGIEVSAYRDWWNGKSELSKKLLLKRLLEKDVGLDALPPSFVTGCLAYKRRTEKIKAAKVRIKKLMNPSDVHSDGNFDIEMSNTGKKKRGKQFCDIDWEDLIIETLLLHRVKEEEIEKGHYNSLLDSYVFSSGIEAA